MKTSDVLLKAAEIVEQGWCQGELARNADGYVVPPRSHTAASWCAMGAIYRVAEDLSASAKRFLRAAVGSPHLAQWNDGCRTQAEVAAKLREAAALAAAEEAQS